MTSKTRYTPEGTTIHPLTCDGELRDDVTGAENARDEILSQLSELLDRVDGERPAVNRDGCEEVPNRFYVSGMDAVHLTAILMDARDRIRAGYDIAINPDVASYTSGGAMAPKAFMDRLASE